MTKERDALTYMVNVSYLSEVLFVMFKLCLIYDVTCYQLLIFKGNFTWND